MNETMLAYCGIDCDQCPAYQATQRNDDELRRQTATLWSQMFHADITPASIDCDGCKSDSGRVFAHCTQCAIRACASTKNYRTCAECDDFACEHLAPILQAVPEAKAILIKIRSERT